MTFQSAFVNIFTNAVTWPDLRMTSSGTATGPQTTRKDIQRGRRVFLWHFFPRLQSAFFQQVDGVMRFRAGLGLQTKRSIGLRWELHTRRPFFRVNKVRKLIATPLLPDLRFRSRCRWKMNGRWQWPKHGYFWMSAAFMDPWLRLPMWQPTVVLPVRQWKNCSERWNRAERLNEFLAFCLVTLHHLRENMGSLVAVRAQF